MQKEKTRKKLLKKRNNINFMILSFLLTCLYYLASIQTKHFRNSQTKLVIDHVAACNAT